MPDSREKLYNAISSKYDLGSFEEFDTKMDNPESRKKLYESVSQDFDLGDFNTFEQKVGLKKNGFSEPTIPPLGQAFKLGGESTPQLPLTSQSRLGEKPIAKLTNIDPNKNYVKPQGKIKDFVEPISPITEDKATQETFLSNNKKRNEYLENFSNTILDVANKVPESFFYQKNKPTLWGTKEIEKGTVNVDGVIKAIDLEAEKIQREQGVALSPTDKQYLITNITNKLQTKKENQNAIAVTDAQLQKTFGYSMTDITGIKMPDGKVVKKGYFDEAKNKIEQTYEQEKNNFKQSAPIVQKTLNVEFAPELEKAKQDVKNEAELKSIPVNAEFDQLYKQEFDKYQSLVNSEQITVEQANVELEAKKNEIINFLTPKFEQINKEAEINYTNATKEIQSRYNKKYQAAMEVQKLAASQRIKKIQDEYSGKVPEEFLKTYAELLNKNIGYEFQKTANQNLQNFKNLAVTEKLSKAMMAGWSDVTSTIGGAMGYAGFDMSSIAEITAKAGVLNPMPEGGYENASIFEKIADTDWWIANGVRALPFSITTMPVGIFGGVAAGTLARVFGAAKRTQVIASVLGGGAVGWESETFLEAGGAYQQAINEGKSEEEASEIASNTMKFNLSTLPLNVLQMMPIFGGGFKALKVLEKPFLQGGYGAIEEILQGWSQAKANKIQEGKDVDLFDYAMSPQAMEEGAIGFAMGQGMAVLSLDNTPDVDKQISTLMSSLSVGGEAQARKVLDIMKTNGAISEKEYNENINLLNYTLEGIKNVESFPIEDNLKASLVNKYVAIAKAKQLHTDDENDLASQASKEMVAEKEKEIKEILKGNEPVYLAFVKGSEVPIVTSKEEIDYILSNERGLEVFDLEVYNDESTNNKIQKAKEDLITTPQAGSVVGGENPALKDVESTAKALKEIDLANSNIPLPQLEIDGYKRKASENYKLNDAASIAEAYHIAKADGSNPELVKAVEESLQATPQEITTEPTSTEGVEAISVEEQQEIASNGDINKDEKTTNEVREVEDGQREKGNEGKQSKGKNDGQKTNDVQNEEVTEGGVKAPQVKTIKNQIADLRAAEQAEYDAMSNPKDKAKREEIYNRYDKLITPLLEQEKAGSVGAGGENPALKDVESTAKALEGKFNPQFKNAIEDKLSKFDEQIINKKFPSVLEVAEHVLPRNIFNKYKNLYEIAARNNITVSNEKLPSGLVAAWSFGNIQLNKSILKYYLNDFNEFAETLNHEIIHGLISRGIRDNYALSNDLQSVMNRVVSNFDLASDEVKSIISYIQDTRNEFVEEDIFGATEQELSSGEYRKVGNLEELITYAFTNSEFAEFLDSIPASKEINIKGDSVFKQLINILRNFVSNIVKKTTALDEINSVLDKYFDTTWNESQIAERNKEYEWNLKFYADENIFDRYNNDAKSISEAYHKAKADGTNPELVKAVEQLLKETTQAEEVEKTSKQAETSKEDLGYHGGNLMNKSDYLTSGYRGDMPFTGYYFFSDRNRAESRGNRSQLENNDVSVVDFSKYNLLKPTTNEYWSIKAALKKFEDRFLRGNIDDAFDSLESKYGLKDSVPKLFEQIQSNKEKIKKIAEEWKKNELENIDSKGKIERLETLILKQLGYEGVDVRGLKEQNGEASPDSSAEGSVIFDLKPDSIIESPNKIKLSEEKTKTSKPKPENVKAIEEAMTKKSGTIKNEIIKEAADPTEVKKILDNLDSIKSKLAGLTTKDGDSVFSEECKWG